MSTQKVIDLIKGYAKGKNYLEIGVYRGGMLSEVAKVAKNATGIDNFSQFDPTGENERAVWNKISGMLNVTMIVGDCYDQNTIDQVKNNSIDVFFYDGDHTEQGTYDAIVKYLPKLKKQAILIIDDWNHEPARLGTQKALIDLVQIDFTNVMEQFSPKNADPEWWNGIAVFKIYK